MVSVTNSASDRREWETMVFRLYSAQWLLTKSISTVQGTLTILACVTWTQSFIRTSPYSHLLPPISSFPLHPITYISELLSVLHLNIEYETQRTNESRQQKILDAQKRRLYRRAHGLENLDAEEEQGIDVRGLVSWDDGLTNKERAQGGRDLVMSMADMMSLGLRSGENPDEFIKRMKEEGRLEKVARHGVEATLRAEEEERKKAARDDAAAGESVGQETEQPRPQEKRKRKLYFGIW